MSALRPLAYPCTPWWDTVTGYFCGLRPLPHTDVETMSERPEAPLRVLKFGGTSVADPDRVRGVVELVRAEQETAPHVRFVVVVSAFAGVTELLGNAARAAESGNSGREVLQQVVDRHRQMMGAVAPEAERSALTGSIDQWTEDVHDVIGGIELVKECTPRMLDRVLSLGERVSSLLLAAAFRSAGCEAEAIPAEDLLVTDDGFGQARVDMDRSATRVRKRLKEACGIPVVPGFIGSTEGDEITTLGRGGSDFTASLVGAMVGAERIEIWTDVDGVMSADPRLVPEAFSLRALSYEELLELSHFGAKVVHAPSVRPAREHRIPLLIRNSLNPDFPGTWVGFEGVPVDDRPVRGISSIGRVALLRLEGGGMVGVPGIAGRLFDALASRGVSVILISQASSEHSICFAVEPQDVPAVRRALDDEFALERRLGVVDDLVVDEDRAVVAAVGEGMRHTPGIAGRLFSILGDMGVNVHAIAQGSSELNISLVVEASDVARALRGLHTSFFPQPRTEARLYLAGVGGVGKALLAQIGSASETLEEERGIALCVVGAANSRKSISSQDGIPVAEVLERLGSSDTPAPDLVAAACRDRAAIRIFVDVTADGVLPESYRELLDAGVSVVAANKRGFSSSLDLYRRIREPRPGQARAFLETTVGAGLPILSTLEDLRATGDQVVSIEGVVSGTLSFLFSGVMEGRRFSEVVAEARERGYTEPDPREDLSGQDVLRKLVILARESGWPLEPHDVRLDPVLPGEGWEEGTVESFFDRLPEVDDYFEGLRAEAAAKGARLVHLATVSADMARVRVTEVDADHPCHSLRGAHNLVAFRSRRYDNPLVVRGAGAGHEVTAAGVLADCVRATLSRPFGSWTRWLEDA
jgi:aspartokinase/homoserine dehydrogenase 1